MPLRQMGRLRRLIAQKFLDLLNVDLNLLHVWVHRNGPFEVVEGLREITES